MTSTRTTFARKLRQSSGLAERKVWELLRGSRLDGHRFRRQHPEGHYIADFASARLRLIIELDGSIHERDEVALNDRLRQDNLEASGWTFFASAMNTPCPLRKTLQTPSGLMPV